MHAADAVISGGVRRSATICLFSPDDKEMATAKTGNWFTDNPHRGRSNNSALLLRDKTTPEQFAELMQSVKQFGEPGFVWADDEDFIVNPCVEIGMYPVDVETGKSGWQGCNLSTVNCAKVTTEQDFYDAVKAVTIIGTLQAGFNSFPYLGETSEKIFAREALLGVSGTGWLEKPEICLNPDIQRKAAELAKETNKSIAQKIGINQAARVTCVKPEGTASCILGTASGIHPHHAKRYIRRVQANKAEALYQQFNKVNPRACEESVWSANRTDDVIAFCIEVPDGSKTKNKITAIELLKIVKSTQQNWVLPGTNVELCTKPWLTHNVSNTINVKPDEWNEVEDFIYANREFFCGISLLPVTGDKDYPQAPFTAVYLPTEMISHYGEGVMFVSGLIEVALTLWEDNLWAACDSISGLGSPIKGKAKLDWVERCKRFANKYFEGDIKELTYCMKDVYNFKLWTELKREYKEVDYTVVEEQYDDTQLEQAMACTSGNCELT
jgi:ribonucleoside-diphosphate reductase alpha chain